MSNLKKKTKQLIRKSGIGLNQEFLVEAVYQNIYKFVKTENDLPMVGELTATFISTISDVVSKTVEAICEKEKEERRIKEQLTQERQRKEQERRAKEQQRRKEQQEAQRRKKEENKMKQRKLAMNDIVSRVGSHIESDSFDNGTYDIFDDLIDDNITLKSAKAKSQKNEENFVPVRMDITFASDDGNKIGNENVEMSFFDSPRSNTDAPEAVCESKGCNDQPTYAGQINTDVFEKIYALDTNILLNDASNLFLIAQNGENLILLPETVLDELDSKKEGFDEINFQAREFARILSGAEIKEQYKLEEGYYITRMVTGGITIDIMGSNTYPNISETDRSIRNDRKILHIVRTAQDYIYSRPITFLTLDAMCRIRATSLNINAELMLNKGNDYEGEFIKELSLNAPFRAETLEGKNIFTFNPAHKPENYCYRFTYGSDKVLAVIHDDEIVPINENFLNRTIIKPRNEEQKFAMSGMCDEFYKVILIEALAGSGKTLLAISAGLRNISEGKYEKLIYIRNSIESTDKGEEVGFLSGNEAKFEIYNHPLYDTLDFIARTQFKKSESNKSPAARQTSGSRASVEESIENMVQQLIKRYNIETIWNGAIRGRTLANAFVIIDECLHKNQQLVTNKGLLTVEEIETLIKNGEWVDVKSVNLSTNTIEFKKLESLKKEHITTTKEKMYEITMEDGSVLKLTGGHKLWCNNKYITVNEIIEMQQSGKEIDLNVFK